MTGRAGNIEYVIGIDPGVTTGIAVYHRRERALRSIESTDFWGAIDRVQRFPIETVKVVVEVANYAPVFKERKAKGENANHLSRMAQNVGQVMREARLMVEGLRRLGYEVIEAKPLGKAKKADDDRRQFERLTGWTQRTSQHGRDAARLAWGM